MKLRQPENGRIFHRGGSLELRLQGAERAQAHFDIMRACIAVQDQAISKGEADEAVSRIVARDPSLLLEPIPSAYPLADSRDTSRLTADTHWSNHRRWFGSWLSRFADITFEVYGPVQVALDAGVQPDDDEIWPEGRLLSSEGWCLIPQLTEMALQAGADPDGEPDRDWNDSPIGLALNHLRVSMRSSESPAGLHEALNALRCVELFLDAGAKRLDAEVLQAGGPGHGGVRLFNGRNLSCAGRLASTVGAAIHERPEILRRVQAIITRVATAGVDLNRASGDNGEPPVVMALRHANLDVACHLVRIGCDTSDAFMARHGCRALLEEAHKVGREPYAAAITMALMSRRMASQDRAAATASEPPARRRARVL